MQNSLKSLYRRFGGKREFKKYLHGHSDEGARLLFKGKVTCKIHILLKIVFRPGSIVRQNSRCQFGKWNVACCVTENDASTKTRL